MAKNNNLTDFVTDIADKIRDKVGLPTTTKINPQNFGDIIAETPNLPLVYTQTDRIINDGDGFTIALDNVPDIANVLPYTGSGSAAENLIYAYVVVVELTATAINPNLFYGVYTPNINNTYFKNGSFADSVTQIVTIGVVDNLCFDEGGSDTPKRNTLINIEGWVGGLEAGQSCTVTSKVYRLSVGTPDLGRRNPLALRTCKGVPQQ